jgi:hypothetical protein
MVSRERLERSTYGLRVLPYHTGDFCTVSLGRYYPYCISCSIDSFGFYIVFPVPAAYKKHISLVALSSSA